MKYQIFVDDELFYSSDGQPTKHVVLNPKLEQNWGSATLSFTTNDDFDISQKVIVRALRDDVEIFRGRPINSQGNFRKQTTIKCENDMSFFRDTVQIYENYEDVTPTTVIQDVLRKHNVQVDTYKQFKLGTVEINPHITLTVNFDTTYSFLEKIADEAEGYFMTRKGTDGYYLDLLSYTGRKTAVQTVEFGENLLDFAKKKDVQQLYSIILPQGYKMSSGKEDEMRLDIREVNNGSYTLESPEMIDLVGKVTRRKIYDDIYDEQTLKKQAEKDLNSQLSDITLEVSFLDLHLIDGNIPAFDIADQVRVISKPHNLDKAFILSKMSLDMQNPEKSKLTLGRSITRKLSNSVQTNTDMTMLIRNGAVTKNDVVQSSKDALNNMFNTDGTGSFIKFDVDENGKVQQIIAMDSEDETIAQKKLVFNKNGIAGSGDGGQTYSAAMTTDGWIYGDRIIAGSITASQIDVSYTQAQDQKWMDELANNYMTSSSVTTAISNSANNVLLSATETMKSELQDYYTKSEIEVMTNEILLSVQRQGNNNLVTNSYHPVNNNGNVENKCEIVNDPYNADERMRHGYKFGLSAKRYSSNRFLLKKRTNYTVSFDVKRVVNATKLELRFAVCKSNQTTGTSYQTAWGVSGITEFAEGERYVHHVAAVNEDGTLTNFGQAIVDNNYVAAFLYVNIAEVSNTSSDAYVIIDKIKVEEGDEATDWKESYDELSYLRINPDMIRLQTKTLVWQAENSSLTEDGILTANKAVLREAEIDGSLTCGDGIHNTIIAKNGAITLKYAGREQSARIQPYDDSFNSNYSGMWMELPCASLIITAGAITITEQKTPNGSYQGGVGYTGTKNGIKFICGIAVG